MDFGRPANVDLVDWTLPPDSALTEHTLAELTVAREAGSVYIGSTAWGQKQFVGPVYPAGTKAGGFLHAYGQQFNTIELNTTFYRVPQYRQIVRWAAEVPEDFTFCPKVNNAISQSGYLGVSTTRALEFCKTVQHFEHKLGVCFIQLPKTFSTASFEHFQRFLDSWPQVVRLAVEFRHESWFAEERGLDAFAEMAARGIGTVITDVGGRRDAAHMHLTAPFVLVRWVGNVHSSDSGRLEQWADRLVNWFDVGLQEAYMFTHQPEEVPSARSAVELGGVLRKRNEELRFRVPTLLTDERAAAQQSELF